MITQIISGIVGGLAYSLSGLANKGKRESFDWKKMTPTLIIAAVVGGIAGFTGQDYGLVANGAVAAGITVVVEKFWKALTKK
jgi:energy-converting hydrogenase Eha subunit A